MYRSLKPSCVIAGIILSAFSISSFAQQSAEDIIKGEVALAYDQYVSFQEDSRPDRVANEIYSPPSYSINGRQVELWSTETDVESAIGAIGKFFEADGFDHIETKQLSICVMNQNSALLSTIADYKRSDGSTLLENFAGTYLFSKVSEDWKILAFIGHSPNKAIQCSE